MSVTTETPGQPPEAKPLIAIVDDDESVREAIAGLMSFLGLRVETFDAAIAYLSFPDLAETACLITDVQMPQMTGIELYQRLKSLGHAIPTIMITAYPDEAVQARMLADGVLCYLTKPFDQDTLLDCVRQAVSLPGP